MSSNKPMSPSRSTSTMQSSSPSGTKQAHDYLLTSFPRELHLNVLTFLRATDLSALQRTCRCFNNRDLIFAVVDHAANEVYPHDLTNGFDTPIVAGEVKSVAVVSKKRSPGKKKTGEVENQNVSSSTEETASEKVYTYEMLRNMEMLVVARVLSRPEPPIHERTSCFYVSKSWCRAALRWLEVQEEERKEREERRRLAEEARAAAAAAALCVSPKGNGKGKNHRRVPHPGSSGKKKPSRKEQRQRERKMSDAMPPWSNINTDLVCEHGDLKRCSTKSARARRRVMDKQAWKVLKRLYPDSIQLEASVGKAECLLCAAEAETARKAESDRKEEEKAERRKPLACPLVRGFYTRGKGYPVHCLAPPQPLHLPQAQALKADAYSNTGSNLFAPLPLEPGSQCPLIPGVYCALPRSWCHRWRKFVKTGEGGFPPAPDCSEVLCDAHNLPLVPPHLESFLRGETSTLLGVSGASSTSADQEGVASFLPTTPPGATPATISDTDTVQALRAAGLSELEVQTQRAAMMGLEEARHLETIALGQNDNARESDFERAVSSGYNEHHEQLDRENKVVVEILTDEEVSALEKWWPRVHGTYALRFAVVDNTSQGGLIGGVQTDILWSTAPCRECDPSSRSTTNFVMRSRHQKRDYR